MINPERLKFVGFVGIDSGVIALSDPCQSREIADVMDRDPESVLDRDFDTRAVVVPTFRGDGLFDVLVLEDEAGNIVGLYVDLAGQYADADMSDEPMPAKVAA